MQIEIVGSIQANWEDGVPSAGGRGGEERARVHRSLQFLLTYTSILFKYFPKEEVVVH